MVGQRESMDGREMPLEWRDDVDWVSWEPAIKSSIALWRTWLVVSTLRSCTVASDDLMML